MLGFHISDIAGIDYAIKLKCSIVQLFINDKMNLQEYKKKLNDAKIKCVVHASYTINLSAKWDTYSSHIQQFINEIIMSEKLGAQWIVIHTGKQLDLTKEEALNNMYTALLYVNNKTRNINIKILLETPSGQGTELCYTIEDFSHFYKKIHKNKKIKDKFGICLDTCHIFSAGYDIRTKHNLTLYLDTFEELIGLYNICLVHLNDSVNDLGSRIDRHASIGKGYIGKAGLRRFYKFFTKKHIPCLLETPYELLSSDIQNIN